MFSNVLSCLEVDEEYMKPKFKVGDKVHYRDINRKWITGEIQKVLLKDGIYDYKEPLYVIALHPILLVNAFESDLREIPANENAFE